MPPKPFIPADAALKPTCTVAVSPFSETKFGRIDQSDLSAPQHHAVGLHHKKAFVEGLHRFVVIEPVEGLTLLLALCAFRFADRLAVIGRLCRDSCKEQAQQADQYHIPYHIVCVLNLRIA